MLVSGVAQAYPAFPVGAAHRTLAARTAVDGLLRLWLVVLVSVIVLQRLAIPGTAGVVGWGFLICLIAAGWALLQRRLVVDPARLSLYFFALACLLTTLFARWEAFSLDSLMMLALLYLPFVLTVEMDAGIYRALLGVFRRVMIVSAVAGLAQFALQLPFGPDAMFPLDAILPESMLIQGFNLRIAVHESMGLLKSTGLWFLEPSHFSQALALAILVELLYFRGFLVLALFGVAYLISFSGTGALLLALVGLPLILRLRRPMLLIFPVLALLAAPFLQDVPPFSLFFGRLEELQNPMASGSMRLLAPYWLVADVLLEHPTALLVGFGPGQVDEVIAGLDYAVQDSSWLKLLVEYGLVGTLGFFVFYLWALFRHAPDRLLALACLCQFLFLGGYLNAFYIQFLHMALVAWPRLRPFPAPGR